MNTHPSAGQPPPASSSVTKSSGRSSTVHLLTLIAGFLSISALATGLLLRVYSPLSEITVSSFNIDDEQAKELRLKPDAFTDIFVDDLQDIIKKGQEFRGNRFSSRKEYGSIPDAPHIPVRTTFGMEYKGISIDSLVSLWHRVRYHQYSVSGDFLGESEDQVTLTVRYSATERGRDFSETFSTGSDWRPVLQNLAERLLGGINPEVVVRYYANLGWDCAAECRQGYADKMTSLCQQWIATQHDRDKAKPFFYLGYADFETGRYADSINLFDQAIRLSAKLDVARDAKGAALFDLNRLREAAEILSTAQTPGALYNLGNIRMLQGDYMGAVHYYQGAVDADSDYVPALSNLGYALAFIGDYGGAVADFQKALDKDTGSFTALAGMGLALARTGRADEALAECDRIAKASGDELHARWVAGLVWLARNDGSKIKNGKRAAAILLGLLRNLPNGQFAPDLEIDIARAQLLENDRKGAERRLRSLLERLGSESSDKETANLPARYAARCHLYLSRILKATGRSKDSASELRLSDEDDPFLRIHHPEDWE
jgi:tetratricopeptide (TPR) repeat protein